MGSEFQVDYATTPNAVLAARYGVTTGTILKWARRLMLRKDPEYKREVQRRNASKAADHIRGYASAPELRLDLDNGMTLCRRCHMDLHGRSPRAIDLIPCACGCGTLIAERDVYGRARRYLNYHARRRPTS